MKKKTSGRRKIEIKRIEDKTKRQVSFSKRRTGLFNKASELCVLTGAEIAILVQSPAGSRVYAFGHPNVNSVIDTYLGNNVSDSSTVNKNPTCMHEYNEKYLEIAKEFEVEKNKSNNVKESGEFWWEKSFEDLEIAELEDYITSMEELKNKVTNKADELRNLVPNSSLDTNTNASNADGLLLDDQVILPNLDQFLPNNYAGVTSEDLMTLQALNYNSVGFSNYSFGNGELVLDNRDYVNNGGTNYQASSDFVGTFGVPNENYFGQAQI